MKISLYSYIIGNIIIFNLFFLLEQDLNLIFWILFGDKGKEFYWILIE